jgi:PAS domain S-box-containing protein
MWSRFSRASRWIGFGYVAVFAALGWALRGQPLALSVLGHVGLLIPPAAVCVIVLRRRSRWEGCQRLFWDTIAISVGLWIIGHVGWAFDQMIHGRQSWLQWHTVFSLCGGIGPLIALLARPHRGVRSDATGNVGFAIASYGLLAVFIYSYFVLVPGLVPGATAPQVTLLELVQVNRALLFGSMVAATIVARRTPWYRAYLYLAIATGIGFFLRIATSLAIMRGTYSIGTLYDLAWIVPFLLYARAALAAPDSPPDSSEAELPSTMPHAAVPVFLIPLIGYTSLYLQPLGGSGDSFRALLTGLMTVAGLGLLTLRLASQGGQLRRADARMRLLAAATEQTGDLILITNANGAFEHANEAFVRALGYSRQELGELPGSDLMERGFEPRWGHIRAEVRERGIWRGTLLRRRRDGTVFPAACTVAALKDADGTITHFVGVERDITDELKLRDQLVHSERLSAMGELVAGVAHEINNPLQTIVGAVELMLDAEPDPKIRLDLEMVRREGTRAGQIVRSLLSFVRRSPPSRAPADLNEIVRATVELRQYYLLQNNITLVTELQSGTLPIVVNREEIQQIVLNLILNAEQAIVSANRGSRITVRTHSSERHQCLEVEDDGPGIGAELRGRIFEPFFTTKDVGQGTGLGLSISHGIASAHGGSLDLCPDSRGACFRLTLPAQAGPPARKPPAAVRDPARRALVVDDDADLRRLLARLLARRGLEVFEAGTGPAALGVAGRVQLSLVLCDLRMPGMHGTDLYRELIAKDPGLARCFIFITGDRSPAAAAAGPLDHVPVLFKPFSAEDLDTALTDIGIDAPVGER